MQLFDSNSEELTQWQMDSQCIDNCEVHIHLDPKIFENASHQIFLV